MQPYYFSSPFPPSLSLSLCACPSLLPPLDLWRRAAADWLGLPAFLLVGPRSSRRRDWSDASSWQRGMTRAATTSERCTGILWQSCPEAQQGSSQRSSWFQTQNLGENGLTSTPKLISKSLWSVVNPMSCYSWEGYTYSWRKKQKRVKEGTAAKEEEGRMRTRLKVKLVWKCSLYFILFFLFAIFFSKTDIQSTIVNSY